MSTELRVALNLDTQDLALDTSGVDWLDVNVDNDYLIFSNGSSAVFDGAFTPTEQELIQAGVVVSPSAKVIVPKYFINDTSAGIIREIVNAGDNNKRYVFAFDFDGATASEPVLEVWDDTTLNTINFNTLGAGTAINSWVWGITTTDALPGAGWVGDTPSVGSRLAGNASGNFLWLNNQAGALSVAKTLYCQLKIITPAGVTISGAETPVFVCKFTAN